MYLSRKQQHAAAYALYSKRVHRESFPTVYPLKIEWNHVQCTLLLLSAQTLIVNK
jgi:hypothetical protein